MSCSFLIQLFRFIVTSKLLVILVFLCSLQMLAALYHMHDCGVLHADIKPDNILVNARHNAVKVRLQFVQGSV